MRGIWLIMCFVFVGFLSYGQTDCENTLFDANKLYKTAKFSEVISKLKPCMSSMDDESKFQSWRLLALCHQNLNNNDSMLLAMREMLKIQPKYQFIPNNDPTDFRKKLQSIKVRPLIYAGVRAGMTQNTVRLIKSYSVLNVPQKYNGTLGYNLGFEMIYLPKRNWTSEIMLDYNTASVKHVMESEDLWIKTYTEDLQFVSMAIRSRKLLDVGQKIKIGLGGHLGYDYLTRTNVTLINTAQNTGSISIASKNPINERTRWQGNIGFIGSIEYAISKGIIGVEFGQFWYHSNFILPEKRMTDTDFIFNTLYTNDDIKFRKSSILLTFRVPLKYKVGR